MSCAFRKKYHIWLSKISAWFEPAAIENLQGDIQLTTNWHEELNRIATSVTELQPWVISHRH